MPKPYLSKMLIYMFTYVHVRNYLFFTLMSVIGPGCIINQEGGSALKFKVSLPIPRLGLAPHQSQDRFIPVTGLFTPAKIF